MIKMVLFCFISAVFIGLLIFGASVLMQNIESKMKK